MQLLMVIIAHGFLKNALKFQDSLPEGPNTHRIGILSVLLLFGATVHAQESVWYARCVGISDGDTINVH
jgi:hypothetical protein